MTRIEALRAAIQWFAIRAAVLKNRADRRRRVVGGDGWAFAAVSVARNDKGNECGI
jgi:hypothetical protein